MYILLVILMLQIFTVSIFQLNKLSVANTNPDTQDETESVESNEMSAKNEKYKVAQSEGTYQKNAGNLLDINNCLYG